MLRQQGRDFLLQGPSGIASAAICERQRSPERCFRPFSIASGELDAAQAEVGIGGAFEALKHFEHRCAFAEGVFCIIEGAAPLADLGQVIGRIGHARAISFFPEQVQAHAVVVIRSFLII